MTWLEVILIVLQNYGGLFATGLQSGGWVGVASNETENDTAIIVKQKWFEKISVLISSGFACACCARRVSTLISVN